MATINTTDVVNGQATDAGVMNANFTAIKAVVNGSLDNANVSGAAAIAVSKLAPSATEGHVLTTVSGVPTWQAPAGGGGGGLPVGAGADYFGTSAPSGWLFADGSAVSRTTYSALFGVIGLLYGPGDGSTTFNLPDKRGRASVAKGTHLDVDSLGDNEGAALGDRRPKHKHAVDEGAGHSHGVVRYNNPDSTPGSPGQTVATSGAAQPDAVTKSALTGITVGPQTNSPTDGPAYLVCNYIIYAGV